MRLSLLFSIPFVAAISLSFVGCGDETGGSGGACVDYAAFAGTAPVVSFKADVLPIFQQSCGLSASCHGTNPGTITQPFLGPMSSIMASQAEIDQIFKENVGVASNAAKGMQIVKPSDAANSFLMHKVDNTFTCPEVTCEGTACGALMPLGVTAPMAEASRDTIRRWIIQGAKND